MGVEQELIDTREQVTDMNGSNTSLTNAKRKLENDIHQMQADLDNMLSSCKNSEEKAKKAMVDAARLADELRSEQDHAASQEKAKKALDAQINELHQRLEEANDMAAKGGKNAIARMEARIRELEAELGTAQSRTSETYKAYQKCERRLKELQFQQDEEKKNQDRMSD